eukprot:868227-Pleurochrysis_carterae.AAC.1
MHAYTHAHARARGHANAPACMGKHCPHKHATQPDLSCFAAVFLMLDSCIAGGGDPRYLFQCFGATMGGAIFGMSPMLVFRDGANHAIQKRALSSLGKSAGPYWASSLSEAHT